MYSYKSGHRQQYGDRNSKERQDYDDRWNERPGPHSDTQRDFYSKYGGETHSRAERTRGSREYSDSPQRPYSKEPLNREWGRKSPVRRRLSSPEWSVSEKRRRRYTDDNDTDFGHRYKSEDKVYKHSSGAFTPSHVSKDFKHVTPPEKDFKYRKTQDSRSRQQHNELTHRQEPEDFTYRRLSHRDVQERERDLSQERIQSQEFPLKSYAKPRERHYSPTAHEDHHQTRTWFPSNGSRREAFEHDVTSEDPVVSDQKTKGFQRFLDVLNKGVNIATLKKIVSEASVEEDDLPHSQTSRLSAPDRPRSPSWARKQLSPENTCTWRESKGSQSNAAPWQSHRSFSPKRRSLSHEKSRQRSDAGGSHFSSSSRSTSPSVVEKTTMTPEEEHKHRQMQGVLQAIGVDLGFEELGQMSSRIQERLYGKKDDDRGRRLKDYKEKNTRPVFSPERRSRSSSSRSSYSPLTRDSSLKKDSHKAERDVTEVQQAAEYNYSTKISSSSLQDGDKTENESQESNISSHAFSFNPTYPMSEQLPASVMPTYPPVHHSPHASYPPLPQAVPPPLPPPLHPNWAPVGPRLFLPRLPPFLPCPRVPPLNILPALIAQTRNAFPQQISNLHPLYFNMQNSNPIQPLNTTQKSKTQSRPRCLQVIDTQQSG